MIVVEYRAWLTLYLTDRTQFLSVEGKRSTSRPLIRFSDCNSAARLAESSWKYEHISPLLMELRWLPIEQRVEFKILLYVFKIVNDMAPSYLQDLLELYRPTRYLTSTKKSYCKLSFIS